ncbi:hypothetical protein CJP74_07500 [Psittacicella melopsittaci]|uniref:Disulfide bond formation protein B n=1 Tax=Psittacicella melopsittaci TaxID=2028576 RepID=A0A3A1Y5D6_9GAMM|nr:disulfide bond formation protein B [Psittacicella melopsittaci]RIY31387.1 hypothetical protein CJP74_07500 [Psittacicella melopsittaci]
MRFLKRWSLTRFPWFLLFVTGVSANAYALVLQNYFNELPCYHCVIDRYYLYLIALAGLIGFIMPKFTLTRLVACLLFLYASVMGVLNNITHLDKIASHQANPFSIGSSCPLYFDLLGGLPQKYFPGVFAPLGNCETGGPTVLGLNLVEWTFVLFIALTVVAALVLISQVFRLPKKNGFSFSMKK